MQVKRINFCRKNISFFEKANKDWNMTWKMHLTPWVTKVCAPGLIEIADKIKPIDSKSSALIPGYNLHLY